MESGIPLRNGEMVSNIRSFDVKFDDQSVFELGFLQVTRCSVFEMEPKTCESSL